jgi:calcineurin-like phosphoesterase family protein
MADYSKMTDEAFDADYSKMTNEEFDAILGELLRKMTGEQLMDVPGVYDIVSEHFNNEVLDKWAERNPEKAYPEDAEDEEGEDELDTLYAVQYRDMHTAIHNLAIYDSKGNAELAERIMRETQSFDAEIEALNLKPVDIVEINFRTFKSGGVVSFSRNVNGKVSSEEARIEVVNDGNVFDIY